LMLAGIPIPPRVGDIYEQIAVPRNKGASLIKDLINSGYMLVYQCHPSRRGGAIRIPRITDPGWLELSRVDMERPEQVLGGGWDHDLCGKVLGAIGKRQKYQPFYEVPIGPQKKVRVDAVLQASNGDRIFCQCCFSSAEREIEVAVEALLIPSVAASRLLMVCRDRALANQLSNLLKKTDICEQVKQCISIRLFGDLLEHYYKKSKESLL